MAYSVETKEVVLPNQGNAFRVTCVSSEHPVVVSREIISTVKGKMPHRRTVGRAIERCQKDLIAYEMDFRPEDEGATKEFMRNWLEVEEEMTDERSQAVDKLFGNIESDEESLDIMSRVWKESDHGTWSPHLV